MKRAVLGLVLALGMVAPWLRADPMASAYELLSLGRADDLLGMLKARTLADPSDAEAWHLLTRTYFYMQCWDDAAQAAQRAVELKPGSSDYQLWLGRALGEKAAHSSFVTAVRMVPRIRGAFERAVQLDGSNAEARADLAEFYLEAPAFLGGGKDKALKQADLLAPQNPAAAHWVRGRLAEKDKHPAQAENEFQQAIQSSPHPAGRWLDLATFYRNSGRMDLMQQAINTATAQDTGNSTVLFEAANILYRAGQNYPLAVQLLQRYLDSGGPVEQAPTYRAHYLLGSILEKQGNKAGAAAQYRAAVALAHQYEEAEIALRRVQ